MNWREWFILFFLTGVNCFDCPQPYVPIDAEKVCIYMSSRPVALNEMEGYCSTEANGGKPFNRRFSDKGITELGRNLKLSVESVFPPEVYIGQYREHFNWGISRYRTFGWNKFCHNFLKKIAPCAILIIIWGRGGLVVRSRPWGRRAPGSRPDSTENPPCMGPAAR
ncbi:hypothetical protein AVEN_67710-1 [Araneus ventricosus]|uniref:Uncharacterized protein n=1 Tax=Araneus ventricosus TaxID=182803 RepID=A0A4Y2WKN4_ARAVE|nr:hypothetical protein AVEN_210406-1 [Araneus ventricosus]GBO37581.1 hypothetical protein AVEN_67710-1 [Araneus ventricosus]